MGHRNVRMADAVSSRARSVESYYPFYAPPVYPEGLERGSYPGFQNIGLPSSTPLTSAPFVRRNNLRWGDRIRYTAGGVIMSVFKMVATGAVAQSQVQTIQTMPHNGSFNDHLYRAIGGYPRNLGLSEKVPTLPKEVLNPTQMQPRPHITRNVFTRRSYNTAPAVPASPHVG